MPSPAEMVDAIVRGLVDRPDQVSTRWVEAERRVEISAAPEDRGKVIGRRGKTIDSLRILATAVFAGEGERIDVRLQEE